MFNALGSLDVVVDARVADLYAGSGALGIEALSRGAAHCTFVERDRAAIAAVDENIADARPARPRLACSSATPSHGARRSTPTWCSPTRRTASTTGPGCCGPVDAGPLVVAEADGPVTAPAGLGAGAGPSATAARG